MIQQCKLCLNNAQLKKSHLTPAGIYKRLRDENSTNPNPFSVTKKASVQTSKQKRANLLCADCEQLLNKCGEKWVLGNCLQLDGSFPIMTYLTSRTPAVWSQNNPTRIYQASDIREINVAAIAYFAASIFWRSSIYTWNDDRSIPVTLGPFQESFRKFLLNQEAFPKHASLFVVVREGKNTTRMTYGEPVGGRYGAVHRYNYAIPGLAFTLITSRNIPHNYRKICFVAGSKNPIFMTSILEEKFMNQLVSLLKQQ